jgi:tetratricopeptide (TPR) repeat protein
VRESVEALHGAGAGTFATIGQALLAETYMLRDRLDEAAATLNQGLRLAREAEEGIWEAELHGLLGDVSIRRGAIEDAIRHIDTAIATAQRRNQRCLELRNLARLYRLVGTEGDASRAADVRQRLASICGTFTEGPDEADVREARALLAGVTRPSSP